MGQGVVWVGVLPQIVTLPSPSARSPACFPSYFPPFS